MGAAGRQFGAPARSLPTRTARLPLMRLCVHATTIPTSEPRPREQVETPERDRARTAGREGSRRDKRQAAGGNDGDNHAGGCLPRLGRRRPGLGSRHLLPILPIPTLPPPCLNQRCVVSVSPARIFLPGLDSPSSSPCSSKNLRCRFSPTKLQLRKSALPLLPDEPAAAQICAADSPPVGMAAAAPIMSGPTVFFVKPWTIQTHRQPILSTLPILSALPIPTLPPVSKPALFRQLFP